MTEKKLYQVVWDKRAEKGLNEIDKSTAKKMYDKINQELSHNPYQGDILLRNLKGYRSYHYTRNYRAIYKVLEDKIIVEIVDAGDRKDIYKRWTY